MLARVLALLLVLGSVPGCSTIRIAYNQADFVAAWMADDYFDFDREQKQAFRERFERFHAWHRSTQLDEYASLLASVDRRLEAGAGRADVVWAIDSVKARYRMLIDHGYADAAEILSTLSDPQLAAARRQFEKNNREFAKEYGVGASPAEQRRLRAKHNLKRIEHWTGPLSAAQEARIVEMSRALPLFADLRQRERMRRQQEFLALLGARKDKQSFAPRLRAWLADWEQAGNPEYAAALAGFIEASADMYLQIYALLTPEQRHHVSDRLQGYISAFRQLAQEKPQTAMNAN